MIKPKITLEGGWCRLCSERLPHGEVICEHHAMQALDERWDDCEVSPDDKYFAMRWAISNGKVEAQ